ncbi:MAG: AmmeMemoRadiSam system protein B [Desulfovibrio sp.]|nr:AmmeMemoRadiSam system protein B [Desulfovibrio sp.]
MNAAIRYPAVAGAFYPADSKELESAVKACLPRDAPQPTEGRGRLFALMLPHAGYVYCGRVIGETLAAAFGTSGTTPPSRYIVLCPNHTGQGHPLGVWPNGAWLTPLGPTAVDKDLTLALTRGVFEEDTRCHLREHSIEVLLPFVQVLTRNKAKIAAVCVGARDPGTLRAAGLELAAVLKTANVNNPAEICLLVSSDMNHYDDEQTTLKKDDIALERALSCDPDGLLAVVAKHGITMCGAAPLAVALYAARALGAPSAGLVKHTTSAAASGDVSRTVGYAGMQFFL